MNVNLGDAVQFIREYDSEASAMCTRVTTAQWNFATNVTEANRRRMVPQKFDKPILFLPKALTHQKV